MTSYRTKSIDELKEIQKSLIEGYELFKMQNLNLDMSRGKPCKEQLDLSNDLLNIDISEASIDLRNYGINDGIPEIKKLFCNLLGTNMDEIVVGSNSSLMIMHDMVLLNLLKKKPGEKIKFLCPSPGYDRHFAICEFYGIEMITIEMNENGPDIAKIKEIVESDESVRGIWCTPKYSNPTGVTFSDEVVKGLASLKPKSPYFRIYWDNAYMVHHLDDKNKDKLLNILDECKKENNADIVYIFASTAKITFAGAGIAAMAASKNNIDEVKRQLAIKTIGPDKINQYRHAKFLESNEKVEEHMAKHASIIKPKFDKVLEILTKELGDLDIAEWSTPNGGYFISFNTIDNCAKEVVKMAKEAGVILTDAGATYPYKKDPKNKNIRIAPTFPPISELEKAIELFCLCVKIVSISQLIS